MTDTLGRREANKVRTRAALITAAYDLLDDEGLDALTAERVADAVGLSRRTFFNYFDSVEAAIALGAEEAMEKVDTALRSRTGDEAPIDTAFAVIADVFTPEFLAESVRCWRALDTYPAARRYAQAANADRVTDLARVWGQHQLDPDGRHPLRASVLTASLLSAFDEARRRWLTTWDGPIDEAARGEFLATVRVALDVIRPAFDR